jgi:Uma2 family endonuclease
VRPEAFEELVPVPRSAVELPLPLPIPPGFEGDRPETWPKVEGRLEFVGGRLLYMPPTGDEQQDTCADVVGTLHVWRRAHPDFVVGGNEAGVLLAGETRGIDAAVWRRADVEAYSGGLRRCAPVLAVEVAGKYDTEEALLDKARWYLGHGTAAVWVLFPRDQRVLVLTTEGTVAVGAGGRLPPNPALPDLAPEVDDLFEQVSHAKPP